MMLAFQTLSDQGNPEYITQNGPFISTVESLGDGIGPWLGDGYYFWEHYISLAHWWGKAHIKADYIICSALLEYHELLLWDLHNNHDHIAELKEMRDFLYSSGHFALEELTLFKIITYMRNNDLFIYSAIRALTPGVVSGRKYKNDSVVNRLNLSPRSESYIDLVPPIQICLLNKRALNLQAYRIVHPEKYLPIEWLV